jgi:hypothetical protein
MQSNHAFQKHRGRRLLPKLEESFNCNGLVGSIKLYNDRIVIASKEWGISKSYLLPIERIKSIVVERKSVVPFATLTLLSAIAAIISRYNALWFLVNLSPDNARLVSSTAFVITVLFAIPTLFRVLFVRVSITWDGDPTSFHVGFVPVRPGKRLAQKFQQLAAWS